MQENQQRVSVKVVEGDAPDPAACSLIGKCRVTDLPASLAKGAPIEVTYAFDANGRVTVRAKDLTGGKEAKIEDLVGKEVTVSTDKHNKKGESVTAKKAA